MEDDVISEMETLNLNPSDITPHQWIKSHFNNSNMFEGEFKNGIRHGFGVIYENKNIKKVGLFENGVMMKGVDVFENGLLHVELMFSENELKTFYSIETEVNFYKMKYYILKFNIKQFNQTFEKKNKYKLKTLNQYEMASNDLINQKFLRKNLEKKLNYVGKGRLSK